MTQLAHDWSQYTPSFIFETTSQAIAAHQAALDSIASVPLAQCIFQNTAQHLSYANAALKTSVLPLTFLQEVSPDADIRQASCEAEDRFDEYEATALMRVDIYGALQAADRVEESTLIDEDARLLRVYLRERQRAGLGLQERDRATLLELQKRADRISADYSRNTTQCGGVAMLSEAELLGLPCDVLDALSREKVDGQMMYKVPLTTADCKQIHHHMPDMR
jgi:Zn-dependent oligopeptidase